MCIVLNSLHICNRFLFPHLQKMTLCNHNKQVVFIFDFIIPALKNVRSKVSLSEVCSFQILGSTFSALHNVMPANILISLVIELNVIYLHPFTFKLMNSYLKRLTFSLKKCISCKHAYVTFLNQLSRYVTNVLNLTVHPEKC